MDNNAIGKRMRELRRIRKLSSKAVAKALDIGLTQLHYYEVGRYTLNIEKADILCKLFKVSMNYLLYGKK